MIKSQYLEKYRVMGKYKAEERNKFVYMYLNYVNTCKILVLKNFFNKKNIFKRDGWLWAFLDYRYISFRLLEGELCIKLWQNIQILKLRYL